MAFTHRSGSRPEILRVVPAVLVPLLLVATGCGVNDTTGDSQGSGSDRQKLTVRSEVADLLPANLDGKLHDELPAPLRDKSRLVMATDATIGEPITWTDEDSGELKGLSVDMATALGYVLGIPVKATNASFDSFIPGLQAGRYDLSISVMLDTKERQQSVDFVDYLQDGSSILVATDSDLNDLTLADMCGLSVGALRGSVEAEYLDEQTKKCSDAGQDGIDIGIYQGNDQMLLAVKSGRLDVMMGAASQLSYVEATSHGAVRQGGEPIGQALDGIAIPKDSPLAQPLQQALQELIDSGAYDKIFGLYGMKQNTVDQATLNHAEY